MEKKTIRSGAPFVFAGAGVMAVALTMGLGSLVSYPVALAVGAAGYALCLVDVGCDHGFLTAKLLEIVPGLTMLASDVSAPSLEKARRLLGARGLSERANITVADGLSAVDRPVDAVMILGMGAGKLCRRFGGCTAANRRRGADRAGER